jgi:hypothetical protein
MDRLDRIAKYGYPERADAGDALRAVGKRGEIHPDNVCAFTYATREAADAFAAANLQDSGYPSAGIIQQDDGRWLGVVDLRPVELVIYDPALPDIRALRTLGVSN